MTNHSGWIPLLRVLGTWVLLVFLTSIGYSNENSTLLPNRVVPVILLTLLLFLAASLFTENGGWRSLLGPACAFTIGLILAFLFPGSTLIRRAIPGGIGGLVLGFLTSRWIQWRMHRAHLTLRILTWIYLLGWGIVILLPLPSSIRRGWAGFGGMIFFGLIVEWFTLYAQRSSETLPSALAFELYVITLNLALASSILLV